MFLLVAFTIIGAWYWCFMPVLNRLPKPTGNSGVGFKNCLFMVHRRQADILSIFKSGIHVMMLLKINIPIKHQISWVRSCAKIRIYRAAPKLIL